VAYLANRFDAPSNQQPCRRHALLAGLSNRSGTRGPLILDPRRVCHPEQPALPMRKFTRRSPFYILPSALVLRSRRILRRPRCCPGPFLSAAMSPPKLKLPLPLPVCLASAAPPLNVTPYRLRLVGTRQGLSCHVHDTLATATVRCFGNIFMRLCTLWRMPLYVAALALHTCFLSSFASGAPQPGPLCFCFCFCFCNRIESNPSSGP
jgi:hypothetical protein